MHNCSVLTTQRTLCGSHDEFINKLKAGRVKLRHFRV